MVTFFKFKIQNEIVFNFDQRISVVNFKLERSDLTLELRQISVPPGQRLVLNYVTWEEFEAILEELGDRRPTRLA